MNFFAATFRVAVCNHVKTAVRVLLVTLGLSLVSLPLFPQANQGTIQGSVFDQSGGAIIGATVTVTDVARGITRNLTSDSGGAYVAPNLIPGTYSVRGMANGFQILEHANILLEVGQTVRVDLVLQAGLQTQTVTVTSEAPSVNTTDTTVGGTLNQQTLQDLPMNGRNFRNVMNLRPGVVLPPGGTGAFPGVSANGTRNEDLGYLIDGLRADEPYTGSSVVNSPTPLGDGPTSLPMDAIQEMANASNPKAETGWKPGAVINMGLKSGTNGLHGTVFGYGRYDGLMARNYFAVAPLPKVPLALGQYGINAGGPIKKDKLFWFADYEGQRYSVGVLKGITTPATVLLAGGNTPANVGASLVNACLALKAGGNTISALSAQLVGLNTTTCAVAPQSFKPGPTEAFFPTNTTGGNIYLDPLTYAHQDNGVGKIDYRLNDHNTINGMYFNGRGLQTGGPALTIPNQGYSPFAGDDGAQVQMVSGAWNWTQSSTRVNEFRLGFTHFNQVYESYDHNVNPLAYGINTGVTDPRMFGFPSISITGIGTGGTGNIFGGGQFKHVGPDNSTQLLDHYTILHGNHSFKIGGEFIYNAATSYQNSNGKGKFGFASISTFLQGVPNNSNAYLAGDPNRHLSNKQYALFFQDDWRIARRVVLNLGLRWEYTTVLKDSNNLLGGFDPTIGLVQVGKQISAAYNGDFKDFSPRAGIAWDIFGNGKTVFRAGGSLMYANVPMQMFAASGQLIGIPQTPTGARIITQATGPAGVPGSGTIGVLQVVPAGTALQATWQAQTPACIAAAQSGGTVTCPTIIPTSVFNLECGDGIAKDLGNNVVSPCVAASVSPNFKNPYIITWTAGLQRAITSTMSLDVSYVGTHGDREAAYLDINEPRLGAGYTPAQIAAGDPSKVSKVNEQAARPFATKFPYLSYIDVLSNPYRSNYNALQATLTQRVSHGLTFLVGYTYQHALDDDVSYNLAQIPVDSTNPNLNYGTSVYDYRHRLTFTTNYQIPGRKGMGQLLEGWAINSVVTLTSKDPWGPTDLTNDFSGNGEVNGPGTFGQYWNFTGNRQDFNSTLTPISCWSGASSVAIGGCDLTGPAPAACVAGASSISPAAVAVMNQVGCYTRGGSALFPAALGTNGNVGRYPFRGTTFNNWDLSVSKDWKFKEHMDFQFRVDAFNVLNHPIFDITVGTNAAFSVPTIGGPNKGKFGSNQVTPDQAGSDYALGTGGARAFQLGARFNF